MTPLDDALRATRDGLDAVIAAAEASESSWALPRAPGKWSNAQIVEHIARSLEESANDLAGRPSKFPTFPVFIRPIVRSLFFDPVLRKQAFPKARTTKKMNPAQGPDTPAAGRVRIDDAFSEFEHECRAATARGSTFNSTLFGRIPVIDYVRFQDLHTRHHLRQMSERSELKAR